MYGSAQFLLAWFLPKLVFRPSRYSFCRRSDPLKRKVIRKGAGRRRSNSHSPKSAKGGRSWTGSGTDSDADKKRAAKKRRNSKKPQKEASDEKEGTDRYWSQPRFRDRNRNPEIYLLNSLRRQCYLNARIADFRSLKKFHLNLLWN